MLDANFWQDKDNSKKVIKEKKLYEDLVNSLNQSIKKLNDFDDLNELASQENNLAVHELLNYFPVKQARSNHQNHLTF